VLFRSKAKEGVELLGRRLEIARKELATAQKAGYTDAWIAVSKVEQSGSLQQVVSVEPMNLFKSMGMPDQMAASSQTSPASMAPIQLPSEIEKPETPETPEAQEPAAFVWAPPAQPSTAVNIPQQAIGTSDIAVSIVPIQEARKKDPIRVQAKADGADEVILNFRLKSGVSYIKVPMVHAADGSWTGEIPGWAVTSLGVEYFVQAKKSFRRFTGEATEESPYLIQVK